MLDCSSVEVEQVEDEKSEVEQHEFAKLDI
jgi:hypothetical protein